MKTHTPHHLYTSFLCFIFACAHVHAADPYSEALRFKHGQPTDALASIQAQIRAASPDQLRAIESKLITLIQSPDATLDAKSWACRTLRMAGSEQCVSALAALLGDKQLAADAQFALRSIPGAQVNDALRAALDQTQGLLKAGVIQTLGARRDRQSVRLISPLAGDTDPLVAEAALYALGQIGGAPALAALKEARMPASLDRYRQQMLIQCAESLRTGRNQAQAAAACQALFAEAKDPLVKAAALRGLVRVDPATAAPALKTALADPDPRLRASAAKILCQAAAADLFEPALSEFASWPPDTQTVFLGMVSNAAALPKIRAAAASATEPRPSGSELGAPLPKSPTAATSPNDQVRSAAIGALGRLGDASDVPALLSAASTPGPSQINARKSLQRLRGPDINGALVTAAKAGTMAVRCEAVRALVPRNAATAVPVLLAMAGEAEPPLRTEALKAIGQLGGENDLTALVNLLVQGKVEREAAENALAALAQRVSNREAAATAIAAPLATAPVETRCALLRTLAQVPAAASLQALRAAAKDTEPAVKDTAIRGLADWPDPAPIQDLLGLARTAETPAHRALALRGVIRLAVLPGQRPPEASVKLLSDALALAPSAEEKKAALGALSELSHRSALDLACNCLADSAVELEAAHAVVRLARKLQATDSAAAGAAVQRVLDTCKSPAARQMAESAGVVLGNLVNIAPQGTATSPDGLEKDGASSGDQAAIDGNPATYWDEQDGAKLYRLLVTFEQPAPIAALSVLGYQHHQFAPKHFEVLCDGQPVKKIEQAQYTENFLVVPLPETTCQTVELKITGYYGGSPAIRELGLYQRNRAATVRERLRTEAKERLPAVVSERSEYRVLVFSKTLGFRHSNIPLGAATIGRLGAEHGFAVDATEDSAVFTPANLARYKVVVFLSVTGDVLNSGQEQAFKDYLLGGGGFVAIHGALYGPSACEDQWAWYGEVCCAAFKNHSAVVPGRVDLEDTKHPSTADLPAHWPRTDEWYNYSSNPRGCARVLATLDESTYQGGTMGKDHPISWCKRLGQGLVWYTAMGHTEESFREPLFLKHLLGGIEFVAGVRK